MAGAEFDWAQALSRAKHQTARQATVSFDVQKKRLVEELQYFKERLTEAIERHDRTKAFAYIKKMLELRANQMAMALHEYKKKYGQPGQRVLRRHLAAYVKDCLQLTIAADKLLGT